MLVVLLGIRTRAMNDAVTVVWRSIERVKLERGRTRIDDVVLGASRNEDSEAGADRTADAVEDSLPRSFLYAEKLVKLVNLHPDLFSRM
jgi:hypothetical protein